MIFFFFATFAALRETFFFLTNHRHGDLLAELARE